MSRPNFRIVEGGSYNDVPYEEFKKDYMDMTVSLSEILKKYGINHQKYLRYGKMVYQETGFHRRSGERPLDPNGNANIRKTGNKYRIDKTINGRRIYCGTYDSLEYARKVRNFLVKHNYKDTMIDYCMKGRLK